MEEGHVEGVNGVGEKEVLPVEGEWTTGYQSTAAVQMADAQKMWSGVGDLKVEALLSKELGVYYQDFEVEDQIDYEEK